MTGSELNDPRALAIVFWLSMFCLGQSATAQTNYSLRSPDQRIEVRIRAADRLSYDVLLNPRGRFQMLVCEDGPNADKMGHDYKVTIKDIDRTKKLTINLAPGGGWAARIYRRNHGRKV